MGLSDAEFQDESNALGFSSIGLTVKKLFNVKDPPPGPKTTWAYPTQNFKTNPTHLVSARSDLPLKSYSTSKTPPQVQKQHGPIRRRISRRIQRTWFQLDRTYR